MSSQLTYGRRRDDITTAPGVGITALRSRFGLSLMLAVVGGFLVVESMAFGHATAQAIGWPVGIGALVLSIALSPSVRRARLKPVAWEIIAACAAVLSAWQVVQALVFSSSTAAWLTFADGCGLVAIALGALVAHEMSTERVVHALEIVESSSGDRHVEREHVAVP